ncbi:hypothetical protein H7J86_24390 [Mycobacterium hackensackense]|uniref:hypothetical protein n=1 Tax=Mycobacterium hackensackense TaxID=228909 RepID=UPI002265D6DB|nr:hypothetical protein [Mycobacterium hackensackense]MCV7255307.1 hypothetical protein [Mycobacterium hackensackense]
MNRAERRAGQRDGTVCEHGHVKKTDGTGTPLCPHRCGFDPALPPVGAKVRLARDGRRWWDVRCADERFAILTRQADFKPKGEVVYTIVDIEDGVRGPCNLIGQSWDLTMPDEACAELLAALRAGVEGPIRRQREFEEQGITQWVDEGDEVEISYRNRVRLDIDEVRTPAGAR